MIEGLKLYVVILGGRPEGAVIEQHNVFVGCGKCIKDLYDPIKKFWSEAQPVHIDAYMCVEQVGDYDVVIVDETSVNNPPFDLEQKLYFVNLGGYFKGLFGESHKSILVVAESIDVAKTIARQDPFYTEVINEGQAVPHIDDIHVIDHSEEPVNINFLLQNSGFEIHLRKVRSGSQIYPEIVVGYHKIPE